MSPRVTAVEPNPDHTLTLRFTNGEVRLFDVKPYLGMGIFQELQDLSVFNSVQPVLGSIQWVGGQDLCPDTLYDDSVSMNTNPASGNKARHNRLVSHAGASR